MKHRDDGYTLAEVIISMLLCAIMAAAVFKLLTSSVQSGVKMDRKIIAQQAQRHLADQLSQYVSGDIGNVNAQIPGPNGQIGSGSWTWNSAGAPLKGEDANNTVVDSNPNDALSTVGGAPAGTHVLTHYLPAWFEAAPYLAQISYTVTAGASSVNNGTAKSVQVNVTWKEP